MFLVSNNLRNKLIGVAAVGFLLPSAAWAKGPHGNFSNRSGQPGGSVTRKIPSTQALSPVITQTQPVAKLDPTKIPPRQPITGLPSGTVTVDPGKLHPLPGRGVVDPGFPSGTVKIDPGKLHPFPGGPVVNPGLPTIPIDPKPPVGPPKDPPTAPPHDHSKWSGFPFPLPFLFGGIGGGGGGGGGGAVDGGDPAPASDAPPQPASEEPAATPVQYTEPAATDVDLAVEDMQMAEPATLVAGPAYRIKFRNQGTQPAGQFQVSVFAALDGKVFADTETSVNVSGMAPGEVREVTLRMPISVMKLTAAADGQPAVFSHLVVALDRNKSVIETTKSNNLAAVERTALEAR